ncbi:MAG: hypothetical protein Q8R30_01045 [bacterium]|nr:hypothetical protein [bacterium]
MPSVYLRQIYRRQTDRPSVDDFQISPASHRLGEAGLRLRKNYSTYTPYMLFSLRSRSGYFGEVGHNFYNTRTKSENLVTKIIIASEE